VYGDPPTVFSAHGRFGALEIAFVTHGYDVGRRVVTCRPIIGFETSSRTSSITERAKFPKSARLSENTRRPFFITARVNRFTSGSSTSPTVFLIKHVIDGNRVFIYSTSEEYTRGIISSPRSVDDSFFRFRFFFLGGGFRTSLLFEAIVVRLSNRSRPVFRYANGRARRRENRTKSGTVTCAVATRTSPSVNRALQYETPV